MCQAGDYAERLAAPPPESDTDIIADGDAGAPEAPRQERRGDFAAFPAEQLTALLGGLGSPG